MGIAFSDFPINSVGLIEGSVVDHADNDLTSLVLDTAVAPGHAVQASGDHTAKLPVDGVRGIVAYSFTQDNNASGDAEYPAGKAVTVLRKGRIAVKVADGCSVDAKVYAKTDGTIVSTADSNIEIAGAYFVTAASAGGLAIVQL